jgi:hypothetical protein
MAPTAGVTHDIVMEDYDARNRRGFMLMRDRRGRRLFAIQEAEPIARRQLTMGEMTQAESNPTYELIWYVDFWGKGVGGKNWRNTEDRGKLKSAKKIETYPRGTLRPARELRSSTLSATPNTYAPSGFAVAPFDSSPGTAGIETELWAFVGRDVYSGGDDNWTLEAEPQAIDVYYRNGVAYDKWVVAPAWWGGTDMGDVAMPYIYKARTDTTWTASTITAGRFKHMAVTKNNANDNVLWGGNHVFYIGKTLSGAHNDSTTSLTASGAVDSDLSAGDIIICGVGGDAEQEPMLVTNVSGTGITVVRAYGDAAVTYEGGEKIHLYQPHAIKSSSDPSNAGSWASSTTVGEQEYPITGLAVHEDTDTLLIAKTDGLWQQAYESIGDGSPRVRGRLFLKNLTIHFRNQGHPNNFIGIHSWNGHTLLPLGHGGLLDMNVSTGVIQNISFRITADELTELHGVVLAIASSADTVYIALKDRDENKIHLLGGHLVTVAGVTDWAWDMLAEVGAGAAITDIQTGLWFDATRNDHHRVWLGFTEADIEEVPRFLPTGDVGDDKTDGYTNATDAFARFVSFDGNVPRFNKHWTDIEIESRNLLASAGRQWTINYRVDDPTGNYITADSVNLSPLQTVTLPPGLAGKILDLELVPGMTSVGTTPPEIIAVRVRAELHPDPQKVFPISLYLADNQWLLNGAEESRTAGNLAQLNTWNASAADLTLYTPDKAAGRQVIFLPGSLRVEELTKEHGRRAEYRVSFLLAEI